MSSFKLKGRESELCTQNYWSEALLTLNLQSARNGRFSWFVCLPSDWQWRQSHFHRTWYLRAFSRGRSEDCSTALSLRKMSGILMEIYCCLPKPYLLLTCHNVASAFFRLLESVKLISPGNGSTGLCEGRSYRACQWKRNTGLNPAGPALAKPPPTPRGVSARGRCGSFYLRGTLYGTTQTQRRQRLFCSGKVFSWSERQWDFWLSKDWKNRVPRLLFAKQTKTYNLLFTSWKTQFAILMKLLHSAEPNASRRQTGATALCHLLFFLNTKNISKVQRPIKYPSMR